MDHSGSRNKICLSGPLCFKGIPMCTLFQTCQKYTCVLKVLSVTVFSDISYFIWTSFADKYGAKYNEANENKSNSKSSHDRVHIQ